MSINCQLSFGSAAVELTEESLDDDSDEEEIAGDFLPHLFTHERALQVRQDSCGLHKCVSLRSVVAAQGLSLARRTFRGARGVHHQHGDGHRAHSTRVGREQSRYRLDRGEIHVANQP